MATETLQLTNFAGLSEASIVLNRVNIFIGPQASGKSVCAKLLFFFKEIVRRLPNEIDARKTKPQIRSSHNDLFLKYFPPAAWSDGPFSILYSCGLLQIRVERKQGDAWSVETSYSEYYDSLLQVGRKARPKASSVEDDEVWSTDTAQKIRRAIDAKLFGEIGVTLSNQNYFIPAGRSFFSTIRTSVFSFIAGDVGIDPFLAEFGRLYQNIRRNYYSRSDAKATNRKQIDEHVKRLICGVYKRVGGNDYITTEDGRQVAVESSSSGQQEALPLALLLGRLSRSPNGMNRNTLFVEEPEAHLYPSAQREIVHLLSAVSDFTSKRTFTQYIITTHSPYILSAFNNLMYGGQIATHSLNKRNDVSRILGQASLINADSVNAYSFDGKVHSIIDKDTGLVDATALDNVSMELADEFDKLVGVFLEEEAA